MHLTAKTRYSIYLTVPRYVLADWLIPLWKAWSFAFRKKTVVLDGEEKQHPSVAEIYQLLWVVVLVTSAIRQQIYPGLLALLLAVLAGYRAWEILIYSLRWLLVETGPLYAYRRSLIAFSLNIIELSAAYTYLGLTDPSTPWTQLWSNVGNAFTLSPAEGLSPPYGALFSAEAILLVLFLIACCIGGVQRKDHQHPTSG